jgi:hypothetical protein
MLRGCYKLAPTLAFVSCIILPAEPVLSIV